MLQTVFSCGICAYQQVKAGNIIAPCSTYCKDDDYIIKENNNNPVNCLFPVWKDYLEPYRLTYTVLIE